MANFGYKFPSGKNHPNWNNGSSFLPYCPEFNDKIKELVRDAYDRKCLVCGKSELENGQKLSVHHTNYDKMQGCDGTDWRVVPLCIVCHAKTNHNREYWETYWETYFDDKLMNE
jgi:hypothetical protein